LFADAVQELLPDYKEREVIIPKNEMFLGWICMFSFFLAYKITHLKLACLAIDCKSYYIGVNTRTYFSPLAILASAWKKMVSHTAM
jgi:hypothetical protein